MTAENTAYSALATLLGDRFTRAQSERDLHGQSESHFATMPPDAVVYPETTAEVSQIAKICSAAGLPLIGWGAGTSLEGHAIAPRGGVTVDFNRMNKVLEIAPEDMVASVQPGITREALNTELRATGLFFPVDPGANASLGGMTSTRASGTTQFATAQCAATFWRSKWSWPMAGSSAPAPARQNHPPAMT